MRAMRHIAAPRARGRTRAVRANKKNPLEQYPSESNRIGSIRSDKIALYFKKLEHLYPINWIA